MFFNGIMKNSKYCEIYKNPTEEEFKTIIKHNEYNTVRGVIMKSGDVLIWDSNKMLHDDIISYFKLDIDNIVRISYTDTKYKILEIERGTGSIKNIIKSSKYNLLKFLSENTLLIHSYLEEEQNNEEILLEI